MKAELPVSSSSGGGRRRRSDAERNTRRIVEAAISVLAGDPAASMQTIAEESGLGRATVYRHFPTREQLTEAIYQQALHDAEAAVRDGMAAASGTAEALHRVVLGLVRNGERYRMVLDHAGVDEDTRRREQALGALIGELVARGQGEGLIRADMEARWLVRALSGILILALREPVPSGKEDLARLVLRTWLEGAAPRA